MKRTAFVLLAALLQVCAFAQTERDAAERIKSSSSYRWGEGRGITEYDAKQEAINDLSHSISAIVSSTEKTGVDTRTGSSEQYYNLQTTVVSNVTLQNVEHITWREGNDFMDLAYISKSDLKAAVDQRKARVKDLVEQGMTQEANLNIAGALKHYGWALNMVSYFKDDVTLDIDGAQRQAKTWLPEKIKSVLSNIKLSLDGDKITFDPQEYDKYAVNLTAEYAGKPVSGLDLSYFNGERSVSPIHAKSGEATLHFPDLEGYKKITVKVVYNYLDEARNYDPEVALSYEKGPLNSFDSFSAIDIPVKISKETIKLDNKEAEKMAKEAPSADFAADVAPIAPIERKTIERNIATDSAPKLVAAMQQVEQAIRNRKYDSVKDLFTNDGYRLFMMMMNSGKVTVNKQPEYSIEMSNLFTIGKRIPVSVKTGRHTSNENIVFRFDKDSGLISSVAYALTKRAEDDIFRQAQWNMESRYSLLTFMEDYQTAFALKRLDYMKKIFSDSAIIIVGKFDRNAPANSIGFTDMGTKLSKRPPSVSYSYYNKDQYINKLERDFNTKDYIQLVFEENEISKASSNGLLDNEVIWIEIKQHYISSNYSDKGFLTLQINMKPQGSQINVRTWTPTFVDLDELKGRFNFQSKQ